MNIPEMQYELEMLKRAASRTTSVQPDAYPFGGKLLKEPSVDMEHTVLLLKINKMQETIDVLTDMVRELRAELHPRYIGTAEACKILGVGRTKMMERLNSGFYPFAFKDEGGRWKINTADLYRFQNQE